MKNKNYLAIAISIFVLGFVINVAYSSMYQTPDEIKVAITEGIPLQYKTNCNLLLNELMNSTVLLDEYMKNHTKEILTMPYEEYTRDVILNEWHLGWEKESYKAGAVAIKLASWYSQLKYAPDIRWPITGADTTDTTCDQVIRTGAIYYPWELIIDIFSPVNEAIEETWRYYAIRNDENILESLYFNGEPNNGSRIKPKDWANFTEDGLIMSQHGTQYWAQRGMPWEWMFNYYYFDINLVSNLKINDEIEVYIPKNHTWKFYLNISEEVSGFEVSLFDNLFDEGEDVNLKIKTPENHFLYAEEIDNLKKIKIQDPEIGIWEIQAISDLEKNEFASIKLKISELNKEASESDLGGVDFKEISLDYISTCDPDNVKFILKAETTNEENEIINTASSINDTFDYFMAALVIPNGDLEVSMNYIPGVGGSISRSDSDLIKTKLGQVMLEADERMKFDNLDDRGVQFHVDIHQYWIDLVKESPYWHELEEMNFESSPIYTTRAWIVLGNYSLNGDNCTIYIDDVDLMVRLSLDNVFLPFFDYPIRQDVREDLLERLDTWKSEYFSRAQIELIGNTIWKLNNHKDYKDLREAAKSIVAARWYKKQSKDKQLIFSNLIDSRNITNIEVQSNEDYWNDKAWQLIATTREIPYFGEETVGTVHFYGGVDIGVDFDNIFDLDNTTSEIIKDTISSGYAVKNDTYFLRVLNIPKLPDFTINSIEFSNLNIDSSDYVTLKVVVKNIGLDNYNDEINIKFYSRNIQHDGTYKTRYHGLKTINGLDISQEKVINYNLTELRLGYNKLFVEIDYDNKVVEINENNNLLSSNIRVFNPDPISKILLLNNSNIYFIGEEIKLHGNGIDTKDIYPEQLKYLWKSNVQGNLGNTTTIKPNLIPGNHTISFTVFDSDGNYDEDKIYIDYVSSYRPEVIILSPIRIEYLENEPIYFEGIAIDPEDGTLNNHNLKWASNASGFLGSGNQISINNLSIGKHLITFTANDSSGTSNSKNISINVKSLLNVENNFLGNTTVINLAYDEAGEEVIYLKLKKGSIISDANFTIEGMPIE